MKKILSFLVALLVSSTMALKADVATPHPVQMKQPDGSTVTLRLHGDEFCSWYTSVDGETLYERSEDGWWRPTGLSRPDGRAFRQAAQLRVRRDARIGPRGKEGLGLGWGDNHFLVLLVEWSDLPFQAGAGDYFRRALNAPGFSDYGAVGSARDYYMDASYGQFAPNFDVVGPITLNRRHDDYPEGDNSEKHYSLAVEMIKEAVEKLDADVDFSIYDCNHDGYVDNIYMIYPGYNASEGAWGTIWPHAGGVTEIQDRDGVKIRSYACSSELAGNSGTDFLGIGTFCHEFGHVIGLPDLYDTDYGTHGEARHPGAWNLMASGSHNAQGRIPARMSTYERYLLGYLSDNDINDISSVGNKAIASLSEKSFNKLPAGNEGEFFLPEVRDGNGWDSPLPSGLIIYHIDRSQNKAGDQTASWRWDNWTLINGYSEHPCDYLLAAEQEESYFDYTRWVFPSSPYAGYYTTECDLQAWDGSNPFKLTDIAYSEGTASFTVSGGHRTLSGTIRSALDGSVISGATIVVSKPVAGAMARAITLKSARQTALYETTTNNEGIYSVILSEEDPQQLEVYVFATSYLAAMEIVAGRIMHQDFSLSPVIATPMDKVLTKANLPISGAGYYGYSEVGQNYTVAQKFTAEELKEHVGKTITTISFSCRANGEEVYVFVDFGTTTRALMQRVWNVNTGLDLYPINKVDVTEENVLIPADTDLYVGYLVKNANTAYAIYTDDPRTGPANPGGFYLQNAFSTQPGGTWIDPRIDWNSPTTNALISFTAQSGYALNEDATLLDLGLCYIDLPATLTAGETLDLKLKISKALTLADLHWYYDGKLLDGASVTLTPGTHTLRADIYLTDDFQSVEAVITVQ